MKTIAVIPARYASTRMPGKPLADVLGKTDDLLGLQGRRGLPEAGRCAHRHRRRAHCRCLQNL